MRCFLNDDDGLSITDTLAIFFALIYLVLIAVMLFLLTRNKLTDLHLDFLQISTWPVLTILGGYFGDRIFSNFGPVGSARRSRRMTAGSDGNGMPDSTFYNSTEDVSSTPEEYERPPI